MIYMHKVFYTYGTSKFSRENTLLLYSTKEYLTVDSEEVILAVNIAGNRRDETNGHYGNKLKSIDSVKLIETCTFIYGKVVLEKGIEFTIPELHPMVLGHENYYLENIFKVKNPMIISSDLKESTNKILFVSDRGEIYSLTHDEINLLSSSKEEFDNYRYKFTAKAVVKDLL